MARPMRSTYRVLTLIPTGTTRAFRMQFTPARPGVLGDALTRIRRRGDREAKADRKLMVLPPTQRSQAC